jgi:hypothetical protein
VWEVLAEKPFLTRRKSYVICLDTLGQDREFSDEQRRFVLNTIAKFRTIWEDKERANLRRDRERRVAQLEWEREFAESGDLQKQNDEEDKQIDDTTSNNESFVDDDSKEL